MNSRAANTALLIVRVAIGIIFIAHGGQKLFGWFGGGGVEPLAGWLGSMGLPAPKLLAILVGLAEFGGGIGVLVGLLTQIASAGLLVVMLVAVIKVHLAHGFFLNWMNVPNQGHGIEYNVALIAMILALLIRGAGDWSIDGQRGRSRPKL